VSTLFLIQLTASLPCSTASYH